MGISEREYQEMLRRNGGPDGITVISDPRKTVSLPGASVSGIALVTKSVPTEHEEQVALFQWAEANEERWPGLANLFSVPNGGYRPMVTAAQLKAEGQKPGVPDCFLAVPRPGVNGKGYHGLFLELKRSDRSNHATPLQKEWIERLRQWGYQAVVCYGAQEAISAIKEYLGIE